MSWVQILIDLMKTLPALIMLVKEILKSIHGSDAAPAIKKVQALALRDSVRSAHRKGTTQRMAVLMERHLEGRRK